jgi:hypothetical protein
MKTIRLVIAAAFAPLAAIAFAQIPAQVDVEALGTVAGSWSYWTIANGSEAAFTDSSGSKRLILRCDRSRRTVSLVRTKVGAAAPALAVWTSSESKSVPARFLASGELVADLAATDPLLDSMAFSHGRFATAAASAPLIALPPWPDMARVIEDCRG